MFLGPFVHCLAPLTQQQLSWEGGESISHTRLQPTYLPQSPPGRRKLLPSYSWQECSVRCQCLSVLSHLRLLWHVPSLLNSPRGFSLQSLCSDSPRPQGHRKLSQGLCPLASGFCLQLRAPGHGVSHQPPLHMGPHISGRRSLVPHY